MKNMILASLLLISALGSSQTQNEKSKKSNVSQQTELHLKKMTLDLDLTQSQQEKIKPLILEEMEQRELKKVAFLDKKAKGDAISEDEKHNLRMQLLDDEIAKKAKMKEILTPDQYAKWEKIVSEKREKVKERREEKREKRGDKK